MGGRDETYIQRSLQIYNITINVLKVTNDDPKNCRMGLETGDKFTCEYETPKDFCPKCMARAFTLMEVVRAGGDLRKLDGGIEDNKMILKCPDGEVTLELAGEKI